jgi:FixJ family two-component response regulator
MNAIPTIFVIESDSAICESVKKIARDLGFRCETYATAQEFYDAFDRHRSGCLVLEICIPGVNGLQIQQELVDMGAMLPMVFLTASASVSIAVHAMRMGAFHVLEKPFQEYDLWSTIQEAIQVDRERRKAGSLQESIDAGISLLSEKEFAVLELLAECKSKQAMAEELGVSVRTIEHRRTQLMRKLKTNSTAGLLRFALTMQRLGLRFREKVLSMSNHRNGFGLVTKELLRHNHHQA